MIQTVNEVKDQQQHTEYLLQQKDKEIQDIEEGHQN